MCPETALVKSRGANCVQSEFEEVVVLCKSTMQVACDVTSWVCMQAPLLVHAHSLSLSLCVCLGRVPISTLSEVFGDNLYIPIESFGIIVHAASHSFFQQDIVS